MAGHSHAEEPRLEAEGTVFEGDRRWEAGSAGRGEARSLLASCSQPPSTAASGRRSGEEGDGGLHTAGTVTAGEHTLSAGVTSVVPSTPRMLCSLPQQ